MVPQVSFALNIAPICLSNIAYDAVGVVCSFCKLSKPVQGQGQLACATCFHSFLSDATYVQLLYAHQDDVLCMYMHTIHQLG